MAKKSIIEIPAYIVREERRKPFVNDLKTKLNICNKAYQCLLEMQDLENIPEKLQDIDASAVEKFIQERLAEIGSTKMLTFSQKKAAMEDWEKIKKKALSYISSIKDVLSTYPDADICVSKGEVVCKNFDELVTEHCKEKTPEHVSEHAKLILAAKDAVDALWNFERKHGVPSGSLINFGEDLKLVENPEKIVEAWLYWEWRKDYIKNRPLMRGAYETNLKNGLKEQNDRLAEMRKKHFQEHPEDFIPLGNRTNPYEHQQPL